MKVATCQVCDSKLSGAQRKYCSQSCNCKAYYRRNNRAEAIITTVHRLTASGPSLGTHPGTCA